MTRIVQLANFYGPTSGGLKTVLEELARCYRAAGFERLLIAPGPSDHQESGEFGTRRYVRAPVIPGTGGYRMILRRAHLVELLEGAQPDAIEVSDKLTLVAAAHWARRRGIPCTLLSHERIDAILRVRFPHFVPLERAADVWNARLARIFDNVVCPSRFAGHEFDRIGATNVTVVPWGVDLDAFSPGARCDRGERRAAAELICVGRLSKEKEPELAVEVTAELHRRGVDVHLTMVGTGPSMEGLQRRSRGYPVTFTGHVGDRAALARLLASADVTLAPCRAETFGLVVLESLASGTPVVTSDAGAAFEVCGATCGVAAPSDAIAMADAVNRILERDRLETCLASRARAEEFSWSATTESVLALHFGRQREVACA